ncbi:Beta-lactamase HcpA [Sphingomonas antarctica]|uniref:tetratricopeptide repeat protein n=1 Tax=Sphingomonas antarctica TaxID=2040274 RepID=UPI0039EC1C33
MTAIDAINALPAAQLRARLAGSGGDAFLREIAEAGSSEGQARLGQRLIDTGQAAEGFVWLHRAAEAGHLDAINMVGRCLDLGWGVAVDKALAAQWFRAAAERGHGWAMYNYATALALGAGLPADRDKALDWLHRANALGIAKAANFIGSFYEDGWAVDRDMAEAARYYARAAAGGDFRGCFNHARMLIDAGKADAAVHWIDRALTLGNDRFRAQVHDWLAARPELRIAA